MSTSSRSLVFPGIFEGDITVVGEMIDYIKSSYQNPDRVINPNVLMDATRGLPLWKMYKSGNNYIVPYVVSSSIGKSLKTSSLTHQNCNNKFSLAQPSAIILSLGLFIIYMY